jgi:glycerate 2-kinase
VAEIFEGLRRDALLIFRAGLAAASPEKAVERALALDGRSLRINERTFDLDRLKKILVLGAGKASRRMAVSILDLLGDCITDCVLSVPQGQGDVSPGFQFLEASHPLPDDRALSNARKVIGLAEGAGQDDLVLCLFSGGGSSLLVAPPDDVTLEDIVGMNVELLASGASIADVNTVRRHVSRIKGGKLARSIHPARFVTLAISDVPGDDLSCIASGPTVPDRTSYSDALLLLKRHDLYEKMPENVRTHLERGTAGLVDQNPKEGDTVFSRSSSVVVAGNSVCLDAACAEASRIGYRVFRLPHCVSGDTRTASLEHARLAKEILAGRGPVKPPACVVSGGETTQKVVGTGRGGRNQEFVLGASGELENLPVVLLSADTDGIDGSTDVAGAICDGRTAGRSGELGMSSASYLLDNDSYEFFSRLGDLVRTGPTGTNVMDIHVMLVAA